MGTATPAATCTLSPEGTLTKVLVGRTHTVSYEFDTSATDAHLALRYLVVINGSVIDPPNGVPHVLDASNRTIDIAVVPGAKVALILNSDVHPGFRRNQVYPVLVEENDVQIKITERKGRSLAYPKLMKVGCGKSADPGKEIDLYTGWLTGDIWMSISNRYTEAEANAMLADDTDATVREAVRRIYRGLPSKEMVVKFPASDTAYKLAMRLRFDEPDNVLENTASCPLLSDVLPRVHPRAYAALLTEARACDVTELRVTSGWRPMFGSIVHRAGLGLDINYVESATQRVFISRASLINNKAPRNDNVSELERTLYADYEQAKTDAKARNIEYERARRSVAVNKHPEEAARFQAILDAAKKKKDDADEAVLDTKSAWNKERDKNEHSLIRTLRGKLGHNKSVRQVLDPWYMNLNTQGGQPAVPNELRNANEKTHKDHLHLTIVDPKIL